MTADQRISQKGFVCYGFFLPLEYLSIVWRRTIIGEGLQILSYARHLWPLSSESSLACHTYCDKGHLFIMVTVESLKFVGANFRGLSIFYRFVGTKFRGLVGWGGGDERKDKVYLI